MSSFDIKPVRIKSNVQELSSIARKLKQIESQCESSKNRLGNSMSSFDTVKASLKSVISKLDQEERVTKELSDKLSQIVQLYERTEREILNAGSKKMNLTAMIAKMKETIQSMMENIDKVMIGLLADICAFAGDPVNMCNGNYLDQVDEIAFPNGLGLSFSRSYNSIVAVEGVLGRGWCHNYETCLMFRDGEAILNSDIGMERFLLQEDIYISSYGSCETIVPVGDMYHWKRQDGLTYEFDQNGRLLRIGDKRNNEIQMQYEEGRLVCATDQYGNAIRYQYDDAGLLSTIDDSCGRTVSFEYEGTCLVKAISVTGKERKYGYDEMGRLSVYYLPEGKIDFVISYDSENRVVKQVFSDESEMCYSYENDAVIYTDERGYRTKYYHDQKGRHVKTVYADGSLEAYEYDACNHRVRKVDASGASYCRTFDKRGNLTHVIDACGFETEYRFEKAAGPVFVRHPDGSRISAQYDQMENMIALTDEMGVKTTFSYNEFGQMTTLCREDGVSRSYTYDAYGNLSSETDENHCTIFYEYDSYGYPKRTTDANGNITTYEYRLDGKLLSMTNPMGQERKFIYDEYDNLVEVVDFDGCKEQRTFDCRNRMASYTDKAGNTTRYEYDGGSNLTRVMLPNGGVVLHEYDAMGRRIQTKLPDGEIAQYEYNPSGDIICMKQGGQERHFEYNENHWMTKSYDSSGHYQEVRYDFRGHILTVLSEDGKDKQYEYDKCGRCVSVEDILGRKICYAYDPWGNLDSVTDAAGRKVSYAYDAVGLLKKTMYPNGNWTSYTYDNNRNLLSKMQKDGYELCYDYDALDRPMAIYDNQGHRIELDYDASGEVCSRKDGLGNRTRYAYTKNGKLEHVWDALGNETTYVYDEMDQLTEIYTGEEGDGKKIPKLSYDRTPGGKIQTITDALGNRKYYAYDAYGQMVQMTDEENRVTAYQYDMAGRIQNVRFSDEKEAFFEYDTHGRMTTMADWNGKTEFTYDLAGRMVQSINPFGQRTEYEWGFGDQLLSMTYPGGEKVTYSYDDLLRKTSVSTDDWKVSYGYHKNGRLKEKAFQNGNKEIYDYNGSGQLSQCCYHYVDGTQKSIRFSYDALGNRVGKEVYDQSGALVGGETYTFDSLHRLVGVTAFDGSETRMEYDSRGNRTHLISSLAEEHAVYNELDQLIQRKIRKSSGEEKIIDYHYDPCGNMRVEKAAGTVKEYGYDVRGRLTSFYGDGVPKIHYAYDMLGHRLRKEIFSPNGAEHTDYTVDYADALSRIIGIQTKETNYNYLWGDSLMGVFGGKYLDDIQYISCDDLGSITGIQDQKGQVQREYAYDVFGNRTNEKAFVGQKEQVPFGFTGYLKEATDGHYYANAREYMPSIGRFTMKDDYQYMHLEEPQSLNLYQYCLNNPVIFIDPSGNDCYIFYLPEWENEAINDQKQLAKQYDCSLDEVHLVPVTNQQSLTDGWNAMGTENGRSVDIDCVVINTHGNPYVLGFGNGNTFGAGDIRALEDKEVEQLILYGCNSGHADYADTNPAAEFSKKVNGAPVLASDGTVGSGFSLFNLFKRKYSSKADRTFKDYLQNGKRKNKGWMVYQYKDGKVNTTEVGEKKMNVTKMTNILNEYRPDCNRRTS